MRKTVGSFAREGAEAQVSACPGRWSPSGHPLKMKQLYDRTNNIFRMVEATPTVGDSATSQVGTLPGLASTIFLPQHHRLFTSYTMYKKSCSPDARRRQNSLLRVVAAKDPRRPGTSNKNCGFIMIALLCGARRADSLNYIVALHSQGPACIWSCKKVNQKLLCACSTWSIGRCLVNSNIR